MSTDMSKQVEFINKARLMDSTNNQAKWVEFINKAILMDFIDNQAKWEVFVYKVKLMDFIDNLERLVYNHKANRYHNFFCMIKFLREHMRFHQSYIYPIQKNHTSLYFHSQFILCHIPPLLQIPLKIMGIIDNYCSQVIKNYFRLELDLPTIMVYSYNFRH